jgi:hypothetical protein
MIRLSFPRATLKIPSGEDYLNVEMADMISAIWQETSFLA